MEEKKRLNLLDGIRGFLLINMILYHAMWDLVYIFSTNANWYKSIYSKLWQYAICSGFIFLSGFCRCLCRSNLRQFYRSIVLIICGIAITICTFLFTSENIIILGVLNFLGFAGILTIPLDMAYRRTSEKPILSAAFSLLSILIFIAIIHINYGYLGFGSHKYALSRKLYSGFLNTAIGFPDPAFKSADYFALLPWIFLYISGYFAGKCIIKSKKNAWLTLHCSPLEFIGRHSLLIYLVHQPIIYGCLYVIIKAGESRQ